MRLVVDTNVVVSGLLQPQGNPAAVLRAVQSGAVVALYNDRILAEYREVIARPRLHLGPGAADAFIETLVGAGAPVAATPVAFMLPDPDDQVFLEVAIAGRADAIVTGNRKDFPDACGVRILSPAELVRLIASLR